MTKPASLLNHLLTTWQPGGVSSQDENATGDMKPLIDYSRFAYISDYKGV